MLAKVSVDRVPTGSSVYVSLSARRGASDYRGRLRLSNTGGVFLQAAHATGENEAFMGAERSAGITFGAGTPVWVRMQVVGTNPTTVQMRAWRDGTPEPGTWTYVVTDSTAGLQGPGSVARVGAAVELDHQPADRRLRRRRAGHGAVALRSGARTCEGSRPAGRLPSRSSLSASRRRRGPARIRGSRSSRRGSPCPR